MPQGTTSGFSIITCTNRHGYIHNIFRNYQNQIGVNKELIIVLNRNSLSKQLYKRYAKRFSNVRVYQLPERVSLGACLNFAVKKARYSVVAKFDDDDYYAPLYARDALRTLAKSKAAVVGKSTFFTYFKGLHLLILRHPYRENRTARMVIGGTICFRKSVFKRAQFPNRSLGEDGGFLWRYKKKGLRVYSGNRYHYCYIRRQNPNSHTWKPSSSKLLSQPHKRIAYTRDFRKWVRGTRS
ncbi:glycosyltransferase family 2 protein [Brevibacillus sp. NRS-1366]|uniref:glycosyltransferase family 2 protein n=1 Tax=Brevibacillus sp. NRS-1366 TaxID=3233899 RepID=UPI003D1EBA8D